MIDLTMNEQGLRRSVERAREKNIIIPTFEEMKNPEKVPEKIKGRLKDVGLWDVDSLNLFRITWKNEPVKHGGLYGGVNFMELPPELTGVRARVIALVGKWFPTGAHKVGATFGCLAPRLVTGQFDPTTQKAIWPSTGNYCRGGAYNAQLLGCESIAILPEGMSRERFEWLKKVAGEVIATPGSESNVKEIFDKTWELKRTRDNVVAFNQFEEFGNYLWHYEVTGHAMEEAFAAAAGKGDRYFGVALTSGSAGTLGCGDYMKELYPASKIAVGEALQCPTLLENGFGAHRIEGIGDKHVPWIHNVKNTDMVIAVDDADSMAMIRLFNEPAGRQYLKKQGVSRKVIDDLPFLGISSAANLIMAIKMARFYELTEKDVIFTVFTDSMELYGSRLKEMEEEYGPYGEIDAAVDFNQHIRGLSVDWMQELGYYDRRRIHNLKYYTWIEQQERELDELNAQWYDAEEYWGSIRKMAPAIDEKIRAFNEMTGLLQES
ncbi:MAG: pyridoxal-phosphate dependent enzyme [Thermovirgaceae bacterium]